MSAVDEAGDHLIEYRFGEVVIRPNASSIPHIEIVAAISMQWLSSYFDAPSGI
jgi:hypothetical protein